MAISRSQDTDERTVDRLFSSTRCIAACGTKIDAKRHSTLRDAESPHRRSIRLQVDAI